MRLARLLALATAVLLAGCGATGALPRSGRPSSPFNGSAGPGTAAAPEASTASGVFLPAPDARIPHDPRGLAATLRRTTRALRASIDLWTSEGNPSSGGPPHRVVLQALYQQRMYRLMVRDPTLARRVIRRLPSWFAGSARANVAAGQKLYSLVHPVSRAGILKTQPAEPVGKLLGYYRLAQHRFHVAWYVLAAVNYIESKFGRAKSASYAGAQGPMQFLPSTWSAYGMGGDIHDPHDAILGAANYLHASGAPGHYRRALYSYNHAWAYVDAVLLYARQMKHDVRNLYAYYNWQVFVITRHGEVRLTGPGLRR